MGYLGESIKSGLKLSALAMSNLATKIIANYIMNMNNLFFEKSKFEI